MPNIFTAEKILESIDGAFTDTLSMPIFQQRAWPARITDDTIADLVAQNTGARSSAVNATKYLFDGTDRHRTLMKTIRQGYQAYKEAAPTLGNSNLRVLPNGSVPAYLNAMAAADQKIQQALQDFQDHYMHDVHVGRSHLGNLAASVTYPDMSELPSKFGISYETVIPFPAAGSGFLGLDQSTRTRLHINMEKSVRARLLETFEQALEALRVSIGTLTDRVQARLNVLDEVEGAPSVRLTPSVLHTPVEQARMLRHFAMGQWADRMGQIESALETLVTGKDLSNDAEALRRALKGLNILRNLLENDV